MSRRDAFDSSNGVACAYGMAPDANLNGVLTTLLSSSVGWFGRYGDLHDLDSGPCS